jgi:glycerophosphoryl diester phosphodiesterase
MARHPYLDHNGPIAFAHRGGTSAAPENSLRAFADAVSLGFRYLETDVHATSDGVLVAFHDNDLERTCGEQRAIATSTWEELKSARIDGTDPIPLLDDLLDEFPNDRFNIDCKADTALEPLIQKLRDRDCLDRVCIGSFSDKRLERVREAFGSAVCTSMGPKEIAKLVARTNTFVPVKPTEHALMAQVPVKQGAIPVTTKRFVNVAHDLGLAVHVWTVDDPIEIARLLDLGVDGVMSDDTRALRDVFAARGHW